MWCILQPSCSSYRALLAFFRHSLGIMFASGVKASLLGFLAEVEWEGNDTALAERVVTILESNDVKVPTVHLSILLLYFCLG